MIGYLQVHISSSEHETIMAVVTQNEMALARVQHLRVKGPTQGMEHLNCAPLYDVILATSIELQVNLLACLRLAVYCFGYIG
jgi:hypothetical protein